MSHLNWFDYGIMAFILYSGGRYVLRIIEKDYRPKELDAPDWMIALAMGIAATLNFYIVLRFCTLGIVQ